MHIMLAYSIVLKFMLTFKMPRKPASENVICLCLLIRLLVGPHCLQKLLFKLQADDKADDN